MGGGSTNNPFDKVTSSKPAAKAAAADPFANAFGAKLDLGGSSKPSTGAFGGGGWDEDAPALPQADPFAAASSNQKPKPISNIMGDPFGNIMGSSSKKAPTAPLGGNTSSFGNSDPFAGAG